MFNLPKEIEEGNIEYKRELINVDDDRLNHLASQMKWRLKEGNGKAKYYLGINDDGSFYGFSNSCKKYGYDRQSAFYLDGFDCDEFLFITQEKERPYNVSIFYASDEFIERGRQEYKYLLGIYKKFFIDNEEPVEEHLIIDTL